MTHQAFERNYHTVKNLDISRKVREKKVKQTVETNSRGRTLLHDHSKMRQLFQEKFAYLIFLVEALDNSSRQSIHTHVFDMNKCSHSVDVDKLCAISIRYDANKDIVVDGAVPAARSARTSIYV